MAQPCQLFSGGRYAVKHNPAAYYVGPRGEDRAACRIDDVAFAMLRRFCRLADCPLSRSLLLIYATTRTTARSRPATPGWPNSCRRSWPARPNRDGFTAILVIWDEATPMPNVAIGPSVRPGTVIGLPVDHYALLRTTQELLALPGRLAAAATAASLLGPFNL